MLLVSVGTCGGAVMLKILEICFRAAVFFLRNFVSGLVVVGLSRVCMRSSAACVVASVEESLGNGRVYGKNTVVSQTFSLAVLGM